MFGNGLKDHSDDVLGEALVPAAHGVDQRLGLLKVQAVPRLLVQEWKPLQIQHGTTIKSTCIEY